MNCPNCFGKMRTVDTRQYRSGDDEGNFPWVERRVVCLSCGHKTHTVEVERILWRKAFAMWEAHNTVPINEGVIDGDG